MCEYMAVDSLFLTLANQIKSTRTVSSNAANYSVIMGYDDDNEEANYEIQNKKWSPTNQYLAALASSIGIWSTGTVLGWSSPGNPDLKESGDIGTLTENQLSWNGSISNLSALLSCFIIGYTIERIGRKLTSMIIVVPFVIGFAIMASAQNYAMMLIGRIITGFCGGAYTVICTVYVNEIAQDHMRNTLMTILVVMLCSGIPFIYIIGYVASWRVMSIVAGVQPIIHFVAMLFVPETPAYLLEKGLTDKASSSLQWLRGAASPADVEHELREIHKKIDESRNQSSSGWRGLMDGSTFKPCLLSVTCMGLQQLGGINAVIFYSVDIFQAAGSDIDPKVCAIIVGGTQAVCVAFTGLLTDRFGRKPLFFLSEVGMAISLTALGIFYYLDENDPDKTGNLGWLPLTSLILYMVTYCVGVGPLPWALMGDLCPPHIKGVASAMTTSTNWGLAFLVTFTFQNLINGIHSYGAFWLFAGICLLGAAFALLILPETKGKSVEEVMRLFK